MRAESEFSRKLFLMEGDILYGKQGRKINDHLTCSGNSLVAGWIHQPFPVTALFTVLQGTVTSRQPPPVRPKLPG